MSDELDPTPAPVVDTPAPVVETPVDPDEAQAIEVQGGKMVPLAALKAAREEAKSLRERASQADTLAAELAQARPYQQFVQQNPQLVQPQAPVAPPSNADPELVELARAMDYYKADGSPDLDRAKKYDGLLTQRATKIAQQMVGPVAHSHAQTQSNSNWSIVAQEKLPNGQAIDTTLLGQMWQHLPVEQTANPAVAAMVRDLTIAAQMRKSPLPNAPPPPNSPPVHTENLGRAPQAPVRMSETERAVAAQRGMSDEKYTKLTSGFQPGRMNPLED